MTVATSIRSGARARTSGEMFYVQMAVACLAVAVLGFAPTYWMPVAAGTFKANPVVHFHGLVFTAWSVFFVVQAWLAETGRLRNHRAMGLAGISLATLMLVFGVLAAINMMRGAQAIGQLQTGLAFSLVPLSTIAMFAAFFIAAIVNVRRREWHKRLMLVAAVSLLGAAVARWFMVFLAPPDAPAGPPPTSVDVLPSIVADLLLVLATIRDWRVIGRVHPAYAIGLATNLLMKAIQVPLAETAAWQAIASRVLALAG